MKKYTIEFVDELGMVANTDVFAADEIHAMKQFEANFPRCEYKGVLSLRDATIEEIREIYETGAPSPKENGLPLSINDAISNLMEFAPNVLGVCPECGQALLFEGWKCFECSFDPKDMTGEQKLRALNGWARLAGKLAKM